MINMIVLTICLLIIYKETVNNYFAYLVISAAEKLTNPLLMTALDNYSISYINATLSLGYKIQNVA